MADVVIQPKHFLSDKVEHFTESVIREMTRQAMLHNAVNLAQGFPDFPAPAEIKRAAQDAIAADVNQYAITWGAKSMRGAIARQMHAWQGVPVDPETQRLLEDERVPMTTAEQTKIVEEVLDEVLGLGPLEPLLKEPSISDILVNRHDKVFIERNGKLSETQVRFKDDAHLMHIIEKIVSQVGRRIDEAVPMLFRMGPDRAAIEETLASGENFREPLCRGSVGVATDEPWPVSLAGKRVYVFHPRAWDQTSYAAVKRRLQP